MFKIKLQSWYYDAKIVNNIYKSKKVTLKSSYLYNETKSLELLKSTVPWLACSHPKCQRGYLIRMRWGSLGGGKYSGLPVWLRVPVWSRHH